MKDHVVDEELSGFEGEAVAFVGAADGAVGVEELAVGVDELVVVVDGVDAAADGAGVDAVVGVDPAHEGAGGVLVGEFEGVAASVVFGGDGGDSVVFRCPVLDGGVGVVGGAVVDDDDVKVLVVGCFD